MSNHTLYGIIGGMGPVTSAEFLNDIYSQCKGKYISEQDYPRIIMVSDSQAPDRLQSYTNDNFFTLKNYLEETITKLHLFGVNKIMICCLVAHACLSKMPHALTRNIISMTDLLEEKITEVNKKAILLSTGMFYELNLLNKVNIIYIEDNEINKINLFIYKLKTSNDHNDYFEFIDFVENLLNKHQCNSVVFACSDLHLINRFIRSNKLQISFEIIDAMDLASSYILNNQRSFK